MGHTFKDVVSDLTALGEVYDGASALDGQVIVTDDGYREFQDFRFRFFDWAAKAELHSTQFKDMASALLNIPRNKMCKVGSKSCSTQ